LNLYSRKQTWKLALAIFAGLIVFVSLWYTNGLVKDIAREERQKARTWARVIQSKAKLVRQTNELFARVKLEERKRVEIWAQATQRVLLTGDDGDRNFFISIISSNKTIPVVLVDHEGNLNSWLNIDSVSATTPFKLAPRERAILNRELAAMKAQHKPMKLPYYGKLYMSLYYKNSKIYSDLKETLNRIMTSFLDEVTSNTASIPVVITNGSGIRILYSGNLQTPPPQNPRLLPSFLETFKAENTPILVNLGDGIQNVIYYKNSTLLRQLRLFPYVQLTVIALFLLVAYILFNTSRKAEQNQVWLGWAKETAHQLGTPLSSLLGWVDYLEDNGQQGMAVELKKDAERLQVITDRFSKIGSAPVLQDVSFSDATAGMVSYMRKRIPSGIQIITEGDPTLKAKLNPVLFDWVVENLIRNAVDAIPEGKGWIRLYHYAEPNRLMFEISDSGKGIPKNRFKTIFKPGYTTKQRGWGLGLSLTKRIVEEYHKGRISVKQSEPGKGTTFLVQLKRT
jgi:signal transduction histidine kinase